MLRSTCNVALAAGGAVVLSLAVSSTAFAMPHWNQGQCRRADQTWLAHHRGASSRQKSAELSKLKKQHGCRLASPNKPSGTPPKAGWYYDAAGHFAFEVREGSVTELDWSILCQTNMASISTFAPTPFISVTEGKKFSATGRSEQHNEGGSINQGTYSLTATITGTTAVGSIGVSGAGFGCMPQYQFTGQYEVNTGTDPVVGFFAA